MLITAYHSRLHHPCQRGSLQVWLALQEMFFRHLYATVQPTLQQRCESWDNYCALFNIILGSSINMQVCPCLLPL